MIFMITTALLYSCGDSSPTVVETTKTEHSSQKSYKTHEVMGFELGAFDSKQIDERLQTLSDNCTNKIGLTKHTLIYECTSDLSLEDLAPREVRGAWENIFLVQGEGSPLHYISLTRKYSIPNAVVSDYTTTQQFIESSFGPAHRKDPINEADLDKPIYRVISIWEIDDIKVELSVMKMGGEAISLYEKWTHVPLNLSVKEKEGQSGHMAESAKRFSGDIPELELKENTLQIKDIFAQRESLGGKEVQVQGTIVKANTVFGTNWYHLQDGSGSEGTNDLTVTSESTIEVGQTVHFKGVLTVDKDFGFGYFYDAIIEDATPVTH